MVSPGLGWGSIYRLVMSVLMVHLFVFVLVHLFVLVFVRVHLHLHLRLHLLEFVVVVMMVMAAEAAKAVVSTLNYLRCSFRSFLAFISTWALHMYLYYYLPLVKKKSRSKTPKTRDDTHKSKQSNYFRIVSKPPIVQRGNQIIISHPLSRYFFIRATFPSLFPSVHWTA